MLELSLREALALGHHYIGTEHLLLALLRDGDGDGVAARALTALGADEARLTEQVLARQHSIEPGAGAARTA